MDYIDLSISNNDLTLDAAGEPALLGDKDSIIQDTKHLIRDSSLLSAVIGERDNAQVALLMQRLELMIEDDVRLVPGTVLITRTDVETFMVQADTVKFGTITLQAGV